MYVRVVNNLHEGKLLLEFDNKETLQRRCYKEQKHHQLEAFTEKEIKSILEKQRKLMARFDEIQISIADFNLYRGIPIHVKQALYFIKKDP